MSDYPYYPAFFQDQCTIGKPKIGVHVAPGVQAVRIAAVISVKRRFRVRNAGSTPAIVRFDGGKSHVEVKVLSPDRELTLHTCELELPEAVSGWIAPHANWYGTRVWEHRQALLNAENGHLAGQVLPGFPNGVVFAPVTSTRVPPEMFATATPDPDYAEAVVLPCVLTTALDEIKHRGDVRLLEPTENDPDPDVEIWCRVQTELMR